MKTLCASVVLVFVGLIWGGMYVGVNKAVNIMIRQGCDLGEVPDGLLAHVGLFIMTPALVAGVWTIQMMTENKVNHKSCYEMSL